MFPYVISLYMHVSLRDFPVHVSLRDFPVHVSFFL